MPSSGKALHGHLPATIDPIQLAERGARLTGSLSLKSMPRLAQACLDGSGDVFVDLSFERGEGEQVFLMRGTLTARLHVTCQRCLEGMDLELEAAPWLVLLRSREQQGKQDEESDTLVADKPLLLSAVVEDELLLAMPMVPTHALTSCPAKTPVAKDAGAGLKPAEKEKKNPFSVFSGLKKTR